MVIRTGDRAWVEEEVGGRETRSSTASSPAGQSSHGSAESNESYHDAPGRRVSGGSPIPTLNKRAQLEAQRDTMLQQDDCGGDEGVKRWINLLMERDHLLRLTFCQENSKILAVNVKRLGRLSLWVERLAICPDSLVEQFREAVGEVIRLCPLVLKHLESSTPHEHMERGSSPLQPSPPTPPTRQMMWVENEQGATSTTTPSYQPPPPPPLSFEEQEPTGPPADSDGQGKTSEGGGERSWSPLTPDRTAGSLCSSGSAQKVVSSTPEMYFSPGQKPNNSNTTASDSSDSSNSSNSTSKEKFFSPQADRNNTSSMYSSNDFHSTVSFNSPTMSFKFADMSELGLANLSPTRSGLPPVDKENEAPFQFPRRKARKTSRKPLGNRNVSTAKAQGPLTERNEENEFSRPYKRTRLSGIDSEEVTRLLQASIQNLGQPSRYIALESLDDPWE